MRHVLGVDLGTSSVKVLVLREDGVPVGTSSRPYPMATIRPGWAEQDPDAWWVACCSAIHEALARAGGAATHLEAVALGGQMHGTVLLDGRGTPLRPAITWADQRSVDEAVVIERALATHGLLPTLGGGVSPGFMLASLAWCRRHEPELWARVSTALLPKDYLRFRLTDRAASDPSDGSGIPLIDLATGTWSRAVLQILDLPARLVPPLLPSDALAGTVTHQDARETGLPSGLPVFCGGSDQALAALGAGLLEPGTLLLSLSTGGQMVTVLPAPLAGAPSGLRTLCHALPGRYLALAATLGAGLSLGWLRTRILADGTPTTDADMLALAATAPAGSGGLLFFPYLAGERGMLLDPEASGAWLGLRLEHGRAHLARAVLEGVAFSLRQAREPLTAAVGSPTRIILAGGLARSSLVRQVLTDVLAHPVEPIRTSEQSALGAALLAALGARLFPDMRAACAVAVAYDPPVEPDPTRVELYDTLYAHFRAFYPKVRDDMHALRHTGRGVELATMIRLGGA